MSRYEIVSLVGSGGMGEVYRARDTRLARDVAIKVIRPEFARDPERIRRFEQEARSAGALSHPNVCAVHDVGAHDGSPFVVMELLEGESLRHRLSHGPIPVRKAIDYGVQAAHGLAAAHEKGIVHRDLKPENLFLTKDGRVKVLDFGLAKLTRPEALAPAASREATLTMTATESGAILGTVGYMAPEQVRGQRADTRADLFALGVILYEMLTGRRAFVGATFVETSYRILNEDPPPLRASGRDVPAGLETVVRRCLEKDPDERFQTARDLAFAVGSAASALQPPLVPQTGENVAGGRRPLFGIVTAIVMAGVVLGVGFLAGNLNRGGLRAHGPVLSYQRLTVQRGRIFNARFVDGAGSIVYSAAWDGRAVELYEVRAGQTSSRAIGLPQTQLLSVGADGTIAVTVGSGDLMGSDRPGTLAEVRLPGGAPRRILDDVLSGDWAPDGRSIAVAHQVGDKRRLEMPLGHTLYETTGQLGNVRVSPTGRWLCFVEKLYPGDSRGSVVIVDTKGRITARTDEWNTTQGVAWSADGREVWFSVTEDGSASELRAVTPDGRQRIVSRYPGIMMLHDIAPNGQVLLTREHFMVGIRGRQSPRDDERELGWLDFSKAHDISADGRTLLFDEQGVAGGRYYSVCVRGMDGSAPVRLGEGRSCSLSPDAQTVLAVHLGVPNRLLLMPTGTGELVTMPRGTVDRYRLAHWLPDGRSVVFVGAEAGCRYRTWTQDLKGGLPRPVTSEGVTADLPSPDGRLVAAIDEHRQLLVCPLDGGQPIRVTDLLPDEWVLQWTADGRSLYVGRRGTSMSVARIARDTGVREPWSRFALADSSGACVWSAVLTPDGSAYAFTWFRWLDELYLMRGMR